MVEWLAWEGADLDAQDKDGRTALSHCAEAGRVGCAALLFAVRDASREAVDALSPVLRRAKTQVSSFFRLLGCCLNGPWLESPVRPLCKEQ